MSASSSVTSSSPTTLPKAEGWKSEEITAPAIRKAFTEQLARIAGDYYKRSQATTLSDLASGSKAPRTPAKSFY